MAGRAPADGSGARGRFGRAGTGFATRGPLLLLLPVLLAACGRTFDISKLADDEVAVASVDPTDDRLAPGQPVSVTFSRDVAPPGADLDTFLDPAPASLTPSVPGVWKWSDASILEFVPDDDYLPATMYTLWIDPAVGTAAGLKLRGPQRFQIVSEPFRVEDTDLFVEPVAGVRRTFRFVGTFTFNLPVDAAAFGEAFRLECGRRGRIEVEIETKGLAKSHSFRSVPIEATDKDEEVRATVAATLRPARGKTTLEAAGSDNATLPSFRRLAVMGVGAGLEGEKRVVSVQFSDEVDADEFRTRAKIDPEVPDLILDTRGETVLLTGAWEFSRRYTLKLDENVTAENGMQLERDYQGSIFFGDLPEAVSIAGTGNYLSLRGERKIGIETVNVAKVAVELHRVYANNLVPFLREGGLSGYRWDHSMTEHGRRIFSREIDVASTDRNTKVLTPIDLGDALAEDSRGIFRLTAGQADRRYRQDSRLVIATDLGLVAKHAGPDLLVAAVSIQGLRPLEGVSLEVLSLNNQTLAKARTDAGGFATFTGLEPRSWADEPGGQPFLITARLGDDLGFLAFDDTRTPTGDLDVGGVEGPRSGYQAYVFGDRGIYRPGDVARLAWVTRDPQLRIPPEFPLTLRVIAPDARVFHEERVTSGANGMAEARLDIPDWAPTGTYQVNLLLDAQTSIGSLPLRVEDFIPDRMKVDLALRVDGEERKLARPGESLTLDVTAMTLFGPPAAGRDTRAAVNLARAEVDLPEWKGWSFGDPDEKVAVRGIPLGAQTTDAAGRTSWTIALPRIENYHGWLRADAEVEVTELGGGRSIGGRRSILVSPVTNLVGIRRSGKRDSDYEEPNKPIPFDVVLLDLDGKPVASKTTTATIFRRKWRTVLTKDAQGRYRYQSEYDEEPLETRALALAAAADTVSFRVDRHGNYRLQVEDRETGAKSSLLFDVYGWGYAPWAMSAPEKVTLRLDRDTYSPGDVAKVQVEAPFAGLMLLTLERDKVFRRQWVRLDSNSAVVDVPVDAVLQPNAYVVATLLRPLDSLESHAPARAFGAVPLFVNRASATLAVEVDAPAVMRPRTKLAVRVRVPGSGPRTMLTVAAVDEGILQITDFATPSPLDFYFQRRRLSVDSHDIWSLLLPEFHALAESKTGGDAEVRRKNLNPISVRRVKPVALWSGVLPASSSWRTIELDVPEFNGALRIMAVAAGEKKFGSAEAVTRVRDPIVLSPNLPRFLAPGDEIVVPVQVYNGLPEATGASASIDVEAHLSGPVQLAAGSDARQSPSVERGKEALCVFRAQAKDSVGKATFELTGAAAGERVSVKTELAVRPPRPFEVIASGGTVREGSPQTVALTGDFYAGTTHAKVTVSGLPVAQVASGLSYLLRYPYGCLEQTTSSCFPLLYFADIARELAPDAFGSEDALYFVNSGIDRIVAMHVSGGGFSYWPGGTEAESNPWASVYATHFLVEARRKDFVVPDRVLDETLGYLAQVARSGDGPEFRRWSSGTKQAVRAYAVYVLALAGRPEKGAMEKLRHEEFDAAQPAALYHVAGAYGLTGNLQMMHDLLPSSVVEGPDAHDTGRAWSSRARHEAVMLDVLATVEPTHRQVAELVGKLLGRADNGRWRSTQENGWAFLALGKVIANVGGLDVAGEVSVGGKVVGTFDRNGAVFSGADDWTGKSVEIRARGKGIAYWSVLHEGVPRGAEVRDVTDGLVVTREYRTIDGQPIDLAAIPQGQVVVAKLTLASGSGTVENVVVADLVPAGLEIENPRLMSRGGVRWGRDMPPLPIAYLDIRDDRLLLFTQAEPGERAFFYTLRAVTQGRFVLPPVKAEAMYDPAVRSIRGAGEIRVVASD